MTVVGGLLTLCVNRSRVSCPPLQLSSLLTSLGLDSRGLPLSTSPSPTPSSVDSRLPPVALTLCASYLLVKLCESGIFTSYQSELLMNLLNTLLFAVYDVAYEDASTIGDGPRCKRTPFYTRYKHLKNAFQDVDKYRIRTENRCDDPPGQHTHETWECAMLLISFLSHFLFVVYVCFQSPF